MDSFKPQPKQILTEQVQLLYANAPIANFIVICTGFFCAFMLWGKTDNLALISWFSILTTSALIRLSLTYYFHRQNNLFSTTEFARWYIWATLAAGITWGAFSLFLFLSDDVFVFSFIIIIILAVITASVPVLSVIKRAFFAYSLPPLTALILTLLATESSDYQLFSISIFFYFILIVVTGKNLNQRILESLKLQLSNQELINRLKGEIQQRQNAQLDLIEAKESAEQASQSKSEFLANMSHEIRTPMNAVIGLSYLTLKSDLTPKQQDNIEKIHHSSQHLLGVINDILDFSKIEAGKLEIEKKDFKMKQVMDTVTTIVSSAIKEKGLAFHLYINPALDIPLRGDPLRLGQVLINLTNNAIKFTKQGSISIHAQLQDETEDTLLVYFEVQDSGIGITEDQQQKLFQSFQQADTSTSRKYGGTGLGLAISKQLAELMGGEIGVKSHPSQGSIFWFTTLFGRGQDLTKEDMVEAAPDLSHLSGAHILVADDNTLNQQVAQEFLEDVGIIVTLANDGAEALHKVTTSHFDAVLMDVQMPNMNGLEATQQIRTKAGQNNLPVIAMTANVTKEEQESCLAAGMDDFISKPVQPDLFYATLARWIQPQTKQSSTPHPPVKHSSDHMESHEVFISNANDPNIIDLSTLAAHLNNNPARIHKFTALFLKTAEETLSEMQCALANNAFESLGALGHRLKTPARTVGAMRFGELCQELEKFEAGGEPNEAHTLVEELHQLLAQIKLNT